MLELKLQFRRGSFRLDIHSTLDQRVTAFFGPSGCGKTTLLNLISGLARPESGHIRLAGETLFDSAAGIDLPPERRRVGYLFQEGRLFPHLNVSGNLLDLFSRLVMVGNDPVPWSSVKVPTLVFEDVQFSGS